MNPSDPLQRPDLDHQLLTFNRHAEAVAWLEDSALGG
jgi:hypothetical protein